MKSKLIFLSLILVFIMTTLAYAAVTLRCYNKDSEDHTYKVQIGGSTKYVTFDGSSTTSVTIQGGSSSAVIETPCGDVTVESGDSIEIKDGCISVK